MTILAADSWARPGVEMILAAGALYAGARLSLFALAPLDTSSTGRRAVAQGLPMAATVIAAVLMNQPSMALAIIFGSSIACLSLVLGLATFMAPSTALPASRRVWPFVFPAALLTLMAGFSAHLTAMHAVMLLVLGGAVFGLWGPHGNDETPAPAVKIHPSVFVLLLFAVGLLMFGGGLAINGTLASSIGARGLSPVTLAATILSALLVLPTLGVSSSVAQAGQWGKALTALVGTVLLNLCLLLPIAILLWGVKSNWPMHSALDVRKIFDSASALPYLAATWRIETVVLVVLGFALVPVANGRWVMGRLESVLLVVGYTTYVLVLAVFGSPIG